MTLPEDLTLLLLVICLGALAGVAVGEWLHKRIERNKKHGP